MKYYATIKMSCVLCRDMDKPGEHHSQQTDTRKENEIPHVLSHRRVLNNENTWTQGEERYTLGSVGGSRSGMAGDGKVGAKCQIEVMGEWRQQTTLP